MVTQKAPERRATNAKTTSGLTADERAVCEPS
jgi:hypothetical protein